MIQGIGKGGNPHTMQITPNMCVGVGTECIPGDGLIATAGGVDLAACFSQSSPVRSFYSSALNSGITTMFGKMFCFSLIHLGFSYHYGLKSKGLNASGPNQIKYLIQSTDDIPINFGFYAKANTASIKTSESSSSSLELPRDLEDQLIAGACGYVLIFLI